jgi:leucine-zipper of insertion element IS481
VSRFDLEGEAGLWDRSSRPHLIANRTSAEVEAAVVAARVEHRLGQGWLGPELGLAPVALSQAGPVTERHLESSGRITTRPCHVGGHEVRGRWGDMNETDARHTPHHRLRAALLAALLGLGATAGVAACSDEDGDGGVTDEEIEDGKDTVDSVKGEVEEEVDSQNKGSNEDDE